MTTILFQDDFGSGPYTLKDGQISPNGKWRCVYNGYGLVGVQKIPKPYNRRSGSCMVLRPQTNESGTSASFVLTEGQQFTDFDTTFYMRTYKHTRSNPNNWETAWFMFRYTDNTHHYYFYIGKNGRIEIGKKDYVIINSTTLQTPDGVQHTVNTTDRQQFLFTNATVDFALKKWFKIRLIVKGFNIKLYVDNILKADITDDGTIGTDGITGKPLRWKPSSQMSKGEMGGYVEDAEGHIDNITVNNI